MKVFWFFFSKKNFCFHGDAGEADILGRDRQYVVEHCPGRMWNSQRSSPVHFEWSAGPA
jgi:hypothetical protein